MNKQDKDDISVDFDPVQDALQELINSEKKRDCTPTLHIRDYVAQLAVNSLISDIVFEPKDGADVIIQEFVDNITDINGANDLIKVIRGMEWQLSRFGAAYAFFDVYDGKIIIGVAEPNVNNGCLRINQQNEWAVKFMRVIFRSNSGSYLKALECRQANSTQKIIYNSAVSDKTMFGVFNINVPEYIQNETKQILEPTGDDEKKQPYIIQHNYGVMSAKEFLNNDRLPWGYSTITFADTYRAMYLERLINLYLNFMRNEPELNFTTRIGQFANQDINNLCARRGMGSGWNNDYYFDPIKSRMFTTTNGDGNVTIQQSTFPGKIYSDYLQHLISLYIRLSGYSFDESEVETYQNEASVNNVNKNVYETTKMKKRLREHDWYDFFGRMLYVFATKIKGIDEKRAKELQKDIKNQLNFKLVSNLLNDYLNGDARVIELMNNGLIDREHAVRMVNEDLEEEEIQEIIAEGEKREESLMNGFGGVNIPNKQKNGGERAETSDKAKYNESEQ